MSQRTAGNPSKYAPKAAASKPTAGSAASPASSSSSSATTATSAAAGGGGGASLADFPTALVLKGVLWCVGWWAACKIEFGSIFLVLSAIVAIFHNLSSDDGPNAQGKGKKGKLSAYSVFNKNATRIAGSMDAEQIDDQIRQKATSSKGINLDLGDSGDTKEHYTRKSKAANQPCVCGSGKKYKSCCSPLTVSDKQLDREWDEWADEWAAKR